MPNSTRTPMAVRVVIGACVAAAISIVACVEGPGSGDPSPPALPPATVTFTLQAH